MRRIKQLGSVSYVYCDADYSRFAHTIGVFWLAGEMAEIIAKRLSQNDTNEHRKFVQIVRLAALFHDTGHMYYSHVAEHYFAENENSSTYQMVKKAINVFSKKIDDKVSLHEMISVMLVNSPIVRKFLNNIAPSLETGYYFGRDIFMPSDTNVIKELGEETKRQYEGICKVLKCR